MNVKMSFCSVGLLALVLIYPLVIFGGSISLQLTSNVTMSADQLHVSIEVVNNGDERALEVQATAWVKERPHLMGRANALPSQHRWQSELSLREHPFQEPGIYFLPVHLRYRDQNGSRFILPYLVEMKHGNGEPAGLEWETHTVELPSEDEVTVRLHNTDAWAKTISFSKITAMDIEMDVPTEPFVLAGNSSRSWNFKIKEKTLWPNTYLSYVMAEFSKGGQHYVSTTKLRMKVIQESIISERWFQPKVMIVALILLAILAVIGGYGGPIYRKVWQKHF